MPRDPKVLDALRRTFAELEEYQRELGVRIAVENMPGVGFSHFGAPGDLDLGGLGLILDTGHAAICGTLHDFLREPHAELAHVHLHDNRGPADAGDPSSPARPRGGRRRAPSSARRVRAGRRSSWSCSTRRASWRASRTWSGRACSTTPEPSRLALPGYLAKANPKPGPWNASGCNGLAGTPACASPWYSRGATSLGVSG